MLRPSQKCPGYEDPDAPLCYILPTFNLFTPWIL